MWIIISEKESISTGWDLTPSKMEQLSIYVYGNDKRYLRELVNDAIEYCEEKDSSQTVIYQVHKWGGRWVKCQQKEPRKLESVILDSDIALRVVDDIRNFLQSGEWYTSKGVPYRRGYLLYGPPGTGKTSFVTAIAAQLSLSICYLNLSGGNLDDDCLNSLLNSAPENSIILLEDIDAIFVERTSV